MRLAFLISVISSVGIASSAYAKDVELKRPKVFDELVECRAVNDATARLACYDQKVMEIDTAQKNDELVVADKADVKEAERGIFGLSLPRIKLFGNNDTALNELTATVKSARQFGYGRWSLVLEDGAVWQQIDNTKLSSYPKSGSSIVIKTAAMNSYLAKVDNGRAFRIKRVVN